MPDKQVNEVMARYKALPQDLQEQVLALLCALERLPRQGVPGRNLLPFAGAIPPDELSAMSTAIEQGDFNAIGNPSPS